MTLNPIFEQSLIEAMTIPLPCSNGSLSIEDFQVILESTEGKTAVVLGPGIGTDEETEKLVVQLYQETSLPMVVDADALNILALHQDVLAQPGGPAHLNATSWGDVPVDRSNNCGDPTGQDCGRLQPLHEEHTEYYYRAQRCRYNHCR